MKNDILHLYINHARVLVWFQLYPRLNTFIEDIKDGDKDILLAVLLTTKGGDKYLPSRRKIIEESNIDKKLKEIL
jgi:hypothetical protein